MQRRTYFILAVAVALIAALTVGLTMAWSQEGVTLPDLTPAELMAKVAEEAPSAVSLSGDVAWTNDLLGPLALAMPAGDAGVASLLQSGSGRFWAQEGKVRFESQGRSGDTVVVLNGSTAWIYASESATATEYTLPTMPDTHGAPDSDLSAAVDMPQMIREFVDRLAPTATLSISTATVAGRESYVLVMTPTAENTVFGSAQVAFDGETFVPLRVQVFAKGDAQAILAAGFTSVSYDEIAADVFEFQPPAGVTVERSAVALPESMAEVMASGGHKHGMDMEGADESAKHSELTLAEAEAQAGFALAVPSDAPLPFQGAMVLDASMMGGHMMPGLPDGEAAEGSAAADTTHGPLVILRYGEGFGTVMMVETQIDDEQWAKATEPLAQVPMLGTPGSAADQQVFRLSTALGSIMLWRQGDVVVLAGGSVSAADLEAFAASIDE
jgi:outer membrane lipoprotein-sorting protein